MEKGYIENGFIVDVSNACKTSEIIYELSTILDLPDAQRKKVCLKLGGIDLSAIQLTSIKALVESMNSEIEFISTDSEVTSLAAKELGINLSKIENKVPTPDFNLEEEGRNKVNKELEKALDKIFGDNNNEIKTFSEEKHLNELRKETENPEVPEYTQKPIRDTLFAEPAENSGQSENITDVTDSEIDSEELAELNKFNRELEAANNSGNIEEDYENITYEDIKEQLKETEKLPTLYIQRTLRSGQSITSEGNIVIIGDVNPGSEIIAAGDITVWGVLGGIAHAGREGNSQARIRALKMNAIQLRIADVFARRPDNANIPYIQKTDTFVPEEAYVSRNQIYIHKLHEE